MTDKTKKIIGREGLILILLALASIITISMKNLNIPIAAFMNNFILGESGRLLRWVDSPPIIYKYFPLFMGYPLYLLIRFIIWAIKTLRRK